MVVRISVSIPENVSNIDKVMENIRSTIRKKTAPELKGLFDQTTTGWKDRPSFNPEYIDNASMTGVFVGPDSSHQNVYGLVSEGTPPHPIAPRRAPYMTLQRYKAATRPGSLRSGRAYRTGDVYRAFQPVMHSGFPGREFPQQIADRYEPTFVSDIRYAISSAQR